jgi:hypothetical protein
MLQKNIESPVEGKTYSLFGQSQSTEEYFKTVEKIVHDLQLKINDTNKLLKKIQHLNRKAGLLKKIYSDDDKKLIEKLTSPLSVYTTNLKHHLEELSTCKKLGDRRLGFKEHQYFLSMLEIELINRINKKKFLGADQKIALLPHCLKDFNADCLSESDGFDMVCKRCSKDCFINSLSRILTRHQVHPYIWMRSDFRKLGMKLKSENKTLGIIGIACIPELMAGMRKCAKYRIPVVGLPLNANRCARWFGEFLPNSLNLNQLEILLKPE